MSETRATDRRMTIAARFLAISYGIAAPVTIFVEARGQVLSQRFDLPPALIYAVGAIQLLCAIGVLTRSFAPWSALALSVTTVGAVGSHLRIGSPITAIPGLLYTAVQLWFALACFRRRPGSD